MVPAPVRAVLLLFPISAASEKAKAAEDATAADAPGVWFMRQTVGNACGTVGLLHAALNNVADLAPAAGGWLDRFATSAVGLDATARAQLLEQDEELDAAHAVHAAGGQSAVPGAAARAPRLRRTCALMLTCAAAADDDVNLHFVCFVHAHGGLYELDGRRPAPLRRGDSSADTLLADAVAVVQHSYMALSPESTSFSVIALAPAES